MNGDSAPNTEDSYPCSRSLVQRVDELLQKVRPDEQSELRRQQIADFVRETIINCFQPEKVDAQPFGSVPLRTYLPDGDIDLSIFTDSKVVKDTWASKLQEALQQEQSNNKARFKVGDINVINAEVKLLKCLIDNVVVDISFNQLGGINTLRFLEEVDGIIGKQSLFKRSIILIKAWCYYDSRLLGAHHGLISTYAVETLVLYIFNKYHHELDSPLQVLYKFLVVFGYFSWDSHGLSLQGPVKLSLLPNLTVDSEVNPQGPAGDLLTDELAKVVLGRHTHTILPQNQEPRPFPIRLLNIIDPLLPSNNLGRSVARGNFTRIRRAFQYAAKALRLIADKTEEEATEALDAFFRNTWSAQRKHKPSHVEEPPQQKRRTHTSRDGGEQRPPSAPAGLARAPLAGPRLSQGGEGNPEGTEALLDGTGAVGENRAGRLTPLEGSTPPSGVFVGPAGEWRQGAPPPPPPPGLSSAMASSAAGSSSTSIPGSNQDWTLRGRRGGVMYSQPPNPPGPSLHQQQQQQQQQQQLAEASYLNHMKAMAYNIAGGQPNMGDFMSPQYPAPGLAPEGLARSAQVKPPHALGQQQNSMPSTQAPGRLHSSGQSAQHTALGQPENVQGGYLSQAVSAPVPPSQPSQAGPSQPGQPSLAPGSAPVVQLSHKNSSGEVMSAPISQATSGPPGVGAPSGQPATPEGGGLLGHNEAVMRQLQALIPVLLQNPAATQQIIATLSQQQNRGLQGAAASQQSSNPSGQPGSQQGYQSQGASSNREPRSPSRHVHAAFPRVKSETDNSMLGLSYEGKGAGMFMGHAPHLVQQHRGHLNMPQHPGGPPVPLMPQGAPDMSHQLAHPSLGPLVVAVSRSHSANDLNSPRGPSPRALHPQGHPRPHEFHMREAQNFHPMQSKGRPRELGPQGVPGYMQPHGSHMEADPMMLYGGRQGQLPAALHASHMMPDHNLAQPMPPMVHASSYGRSLAGRSPLGSVSSTEEQQHYQQALAKSAGLHPDPEATLSIRSGTWHLEGQSSSVEDMTPGAMRDARSMHSSPMDGSSTGRSSAVRSVSERGPPGASTSGPLPSKEGPPPQVPPPTSNSSVPHQGSVPPAPSQTRSAGSNNIMASGVRNMSSDNEVDGMVARGDNMEDPAGAKTTSTGSPALRLGAGSFSSSVSDAPGPRSISGSRVTPRSPPLRVASQHQLEVKGGQEEIVRRDLGASPRMAAQSHVHQQMWAMTQENIFRAMDNLAHMAGQSGVSRSLPEGAHFYGPLPEGLSPLGLQGYSRGPWPPQMLGSQGPNVPPMGTSYPSKPGPLPTVASSHGMFINALGRVPGGTEVMEHLQITHSGSRPQQPQGSSSITAGGPPPLPPAQPNISGTSGSITSSIPMDFFTQPPRPGQPAGARNQAQMIQQQQQPSMQVGMPRNHMEAAGGHAGSGGTFPGPFMPPPPPGMSNPSIMPGGWSFPGVNNSNNQMMPGGGPMNDVGPSSPRRKASSGEENLEAPGDQGMGAPMRGAPRAGSTPFGSRKGHPPPHGASGLLYGEEGQEAGMPLTSTSGPPGDRGDASGGGNSQASSQGGNNSARQGNQSVMLNTLPGMASGMPYIQHPMFPLMRPPLQGPLMGFPLQLHDLMAQGGLPQAFLPMFGHMDPNSQATAANIRQVLAQQGWDLSHAGLGGGLSSSNPALVHPSVLSLNPSPRAQGQGPANAAQPALPSAGPQAAALGSSSKSTASPSSKRGPEGPSARRQPGQGGPAPHGGTVPPPPMGTSLPLFGSLQPVDLPTDDAPGVHTPQSTRDGLKPRAGPTVSIPSPGEERPSRHSTPGSRIKTEGGETADNEAPRSGRKRRGELADSSGSVGLGGPPGALSHRPSDRRLSSDESYRGRDDGRGPRLSLDLQGRPSATGGRGDRDGAPDWPEVRGEGGEVGPPPLAVPSLSGHGGPSANLIAIAVKQLQAGATSPKSRGSRGGSRASLVEDGTGSSATTPLKLPLHKQAVLAQASQHTTARDITASAAIAAAAATAAVEAAHASHVRRVGSGTLLGSPSMSGQLSAAAIEGEQGSLGDTASQVATLNTPVAAMETGPSPTSLNSSAILRTLEEDDTNVSVGVSRLGSQVEGCEVSSIQEALQLVSEELPVDGAEGQTALRKAVVEVATAYGLSIQGSGEGKPEETGSQGPPGFGVGVPPVTTCASSSAPGAPESPLSVPSSPPSEEGSQERKIRPIGNRLFSDALFKATRSVHQGSHGRVSRQDSGTTEGATAASTETGVNTQNRFPRSFSGPYISRASDGGGRSRGPQYGGEGLQADVAKGPPLRGPQRSSGGRQMMQSLSEGHARAGPPPGLGGGDAGGHTDPRQVPSEGRYISDVPPQRKMPFEAPPGLPRPTSIPSYYEGDRGMPGPRHSYELQDEGHGARWEDRYSSKDGGETSGSRNPSGLSWTGARSRSESQITVPDSQEGPTSRPPPMRYDGGRQRGHPGSRRMNETPHDEGGVGHRGRYSSGGYGDYGGGDRSSDYRSSYISRRNSLDVSGGGHNMVGHVGSDSSDFNLADEDFPALGSASGHSSRSRMRSTPGSDGPILGAPASKVKKTKQ